MRHPDKDSRELASAAGVQERERPDSTSLGDLLEIRALSGLNLYPEVREHARSRGLTSILFRGPVAGELADAILADREPELAPALIGEARELVALMSEFSPVLSDRPTDPAWGVYLIERLARERAALLIVPTLRWGADAVGRVPLWRIRREVLRAFRLARWRAA